MAGAQVSQVVETVLRDLLGAKKAVRLYPAGNPLAAEWIQRAHRSLESGLREGFPSSLRIGPGRFEWDGGELQTRDPALEAFRFELQTRRVTEIAVQPGVKVHEIQELLDCLNLPAQEVEAAGGLAVVLARRPVVHIALRGLPWGGGPPGASATPGVSTERFDLLDDLAALVLEAIRRALRDLTYDGSRLVGWLTAVGQPGDRADHLFTAVEMLIPLIEEEPDREIRYRTLCEALVALADPLRATLAAAWLVPRAWTPHVLNLLTRFSAEEFAELTAPVPVATLEQLRADLEHMPGEDWRKEWLRASLEDALAAREVAEPPPLPLPPAGDPPTAAVRTRIQAACAPAEVLGHSVTVLFQLLATAGPEGYPAFLVDALEEAIGEALARDQLGLALRVLKSLANADQLHPEWSGEHRQRFHLLQRRLSGRAHVALLADLLRRSARAEDLLAAAEYLGLLGREAIEEFTALVAGEGETERRGPLLDVLAALGPAAVPALRSWVGDPRWTVARSMVALLARIGDPAAFASVEKVAQHEHPQVRREAARALAALGGKQAVKPLLGYLADPDDDVRITAIKLLATLMDASTVAPIREFLSTQTRTVADVLVKREIIAALASIASPEALQVLEGIAQRRVWPWQRHELTVRELAEDAVRTIRAGGRPAGETPGDG